MRIAFLGTPEFALPSLRMLCHSGHTVAVFTQPDRPVGRHGTLTPPPVKQEAQKLGIPVFQFEKIRRPEGVAALNDFAPDLMVTAAFGQLLSAENLAIPKYGCINVHGSLLPRYRGAAPIQWAVIDGAPTTGITTMFTDIGVDTGDMLLRAETAIDENETAGELYDRLAVLGADVLQRTLLALENGTLVRTPQDEALSTKCPMLKKEHGKIDFSLTCRQVHNLVRGVNPWPGAYCTNEEAPLKIWKTHLTTDASIDAPIGTCSGDEKTGLFVQCADGKLEIIELQCSGGKRLNAKTFLRGKSMDGKVLS